MPCSNENWKTSLGCGVLVQSAVTPDSVEHRNLASHILSVIVYHISNDRWWSGLSITVMSISSSAMTC